MKPIIIGTTNPYSKDPADALCPHVPGCAGWRLWKLVALRTGATQEQYMQAFDRRNLGTHPLDFHPCSTVVLLGEDVRKALKLSKQLIHPIIHNEVTFRQVPHPSGRTLFYNDPVCRELVAMLFEELYNGAHQ